MPATAILIIDISGLGDTEPFRRRFASAVSSRPADILTMVARVYEVTMLPCRAHVAAACNQDSFDPLLE